jgi:hypothetical protein
MKPNGSAAVLANENTTASALANHRCQARFAPAPDWRARMLDYAKVASRD